MSDDVKVKISAIWASTVITVVAMFCWTPKSEPEKPRCPHCHHVMQPTEPDEVRNCHPGAPTTLHSKQGTKLLPTEECELVNP